MTERERFLATLLDGECDRFPFFDLEPADDTIARWRREGLPKGVSVAEFFGLEVHHSVGLEIRSAPFYSQAPDLLNDPDAFRRHYDVDDPDRYPKGFTRTCRRARREGRVVFVNASGGGLLQMLGVGDWESLTTACIALVERPKEVKALLEKTADFYCACLDRVLSEVSVDYASFYEPIASNAGPVVSPEMFRRFSLPVYEKVIHLLERHAVPLRILCTTGGDLSSLLPSLIDAGINGLWISNIASTRMQYSALRAEFGPDIALIGGIDATALTENEKAVERVVLDTVPPLLDSGAYLPCLDDRPRANMPFALYRHYRGVLEALA